MASARTLLTTLVALTALLLAGWSAFVAFENRITVPMWDMVGMELFIATTFLPDPGIQSLLSLVDNEHKTYVPFLLFLADHVLFRSQGAFLVLCNLALAAGAACLAASAFRPASGVERDPASRFLTSRFLAISLLLCLFLWPYHGDSLTWPRQVHVHMAIFLSLAAFDLASRMPSGAGSTIPTLRLTALCLLLFAACFSFAYGYVALPLVLCLAVQQRWRLAATAAVAATLLLVVVILAATWARPEQHADPLTSLLQPWETARYLAILLGQLPAKLWLAGTGSGSQLAVALACGTAGVLAASYLALRFLLVGGREVDRAGERFALLVTLFAAGCALATALGRINFGPEQALTPRYMVCSVCFWVGLTGLLSHRLRLPLSRFTESALGFRGLAALPLLGLLALGASHGAQLQASHADGYRLRGVLKLMGLSDRAFDREPGHYGLMPSGSEGMADALFDYYRQRQSGPFAAAWTGWLGQHLQSIAPRDRRRDCSGQVEQVVRDEAGPPALLLRGYLENGLQNARWAVIVDSDGVVAGLGPVTGERFVVPLLPETGQTYRLFLLHEGQACRFAYFEPG